MERLILGFATLLLVTPFSNLSAQEFEQPPSDRLAMVPAIAFESADPAFNADIPVQNPAEKDSINIAATEAMAKSNVMMFADQQSKSQAVKLEQPTGSSSMFLPIILLFGTLTIVGLVVCIGIHIRNHPFQSDQDIIAE